MLVVEEVENQNMKKENQIYLCIYSINKQAYYIIDNYHTCSFLSIFCIIIIHVYLFMSTNITLDILKLLHSIS